MPTGVLKKFFDDKGFGFIAPDDGTGDLFAHKRTFVGAESDLRDGARVNYEATIEERTNKPRASTWSIEGGGSGGGAAASVASAFQMPRLGQGTGTLKRYFQEKGFGFIACDDGGGDVFAPARTFRGDELSLRDGMRVSYETGVDDKTGKTRATSWDALPDLAAGLGMMAGIAGLGGLGGLGAMGLGGFGPMLGQPAVDARVSPFGLPMDGSLAGLLGQPGLAAPLAQVGQPGLPLGWEQVSDPTTGNIYYCNRATGESSWTPPAATGLPAAAVPAGTALDPAAAAAAAAAVAGTMPAVMDMQAASGTMPVATAMPTASEPATTVAADPAAAAAGATGAATMPATAPAATPAAAPLPAGWESTTDPNSGKIYYFNRSSGQTSWDVPQA